SCGLSQGRPHASRVRLYPTLMVSLKSAPRRVRSRKSVLPYLHGESIPSIWKNRVVQNINAIRSEPPMAAIGFKVISKTSETRLRGFLTFALGFLFLSRGLHSPRRGHADDQSSQTAECQGRIGGRIFSNGGELEVEMLAADAGFTIELYLMSPGPQRL